MCCYRSVRIVSGFLFTQCARGPLCGSALVSPGWPQCHVLKCLATGFSFLIFQNAWYFNIFMLSIFSYGNTDEYVVFKLLLVSYLKGTLLGLVYDSSLYMQKLYFI